MGLPNTLRGLRNHLGTPAPDAPVGRRVRLLPVALVLTAGLSIFWCVASPARAAPPASGSTTTTVFTLEGTAKAQVEDLTAQANAIKAEIDTLDQELELKSKEYDKCLGQLDAANARMSELRRTVADAQADKAKRQAMLAQRIKSVYMSGGRDQLLQLLLLAGGLQDLYNRVRLVSTIADQDKRLISDLKASSERLDLLLRAVEDQKREELALRRQLTDRAAGIQAVLATREQTLAGIDQTVKVVFEQERQRQKAEQERLQRELEAKLAAAAAAAAAISAAGSPTYPNILRPEQIALVAQKAGFTGRDLVIAVAVALADSHGNANAKGDVAIGGSFGLWQIYCVAHPYLIPPNDPNSVAWYDPYQNAQWAYRISGGSNWLPWSTYIHGTYQSYMASAQTAVDLILGNSSSEPTASPITTTTTTTATAPATPPVPAP
jgi:peptidoglycan hydrolase CwlO-like protein